MYLLLRATHYCGLWYGRKVAGVTDCFIYFFSKLGVTHLLDYLVLERRSAQFMPEASGGVVIAADQKNLAAARFLHS